MPKMTDYTHFLKTQCITAFTVHVWVECIAVALSRFLCFLYYMYMWYGT